MCIKNFSSSLGPCAIASTGFLLVGVGLISMLVCGILGKMGKLPMAPYGGRIMIGLSLTIIFTLISFAVGCVQALKEERAPGYRTTYYQN